ncbi:hypothetical protein [Nitrosovibrio sp. Nv17]|uniref:hypothetical protein n=1 Tax=Nitrosovibrio sp. Nv17 TaxID=1855339 RepID=UPI000908B3E9|nr:hypothetical protein [Nitrosovibrio sp. Nv17]SFW21807.1 hypothetical protein SAMN05216414_106108 [Nitrosovibrio sp. Nv17]
MDIRIADCPLGAKCEEIRMEGTPVLHRCPWYVEIRGVDANTGKETADWGCAIAWLPALMINAANESRKGAAATESFRNEMARQGRKTREAMLAPGHRTLPHGGAEACE